MVTEQARANPALHTVDSAHPPGAPAAVSPPTAVELPGAPETAYQPVAPTLKTSPEAEAPSSFALEAGTELPLGVTAPASEPAGAISSETSPAAVPDTNRVVPVAPEIPVSAAHDRRDTLRTRAEVAAEPAASRTERPGGNARIRIDDAPASLDQAAADADNAKLLAEAFTAFADAASASAQHMPHAGDQPDVPIRAATPPNAEPVAPLVPQAIFVPTSSELAAPALTAEPTTIRAHVAAPAPEAIATTRAVQAEQLFPQPAQQSNTEEHNAAQVNTETHAAVPPPAPETPAAAAGAGSGANGVDIPHAAGAEYSSNPEEFKNSEQMQLPAIRDVLAAIGPAHADAVAAIAQYLQSITSEVVKPKAERNIPEPPAEVAALLESKVFTIHQPEIGGITIPAFLQQAYINLLKKEGDAVFIPPSQEALAIEQGRKNEITELRLTRVSNYLRAAIGAGVYKSGNAIDWLAISKRTGVGIQFINKHRQVWIRQGLVATVLGVGSFALRVPPEIKIVPPRRTSVKKPQVKKYLTEQMISGALQPGDRIDMDVVARATDTHRVTAIQAASEMSDIIIVHGLGAYYLEVPPGARSTEKKKQPIGKQRVEASLPKIIKKYHYKRGDIVDINAIARAAGVHPATVMSTLRARDDFVSVRGVGTFYLEAPPGTKSKPPIRQSADQRLVRNLLKERISSGTYQPDAFIDLQELARETGIAYDTVRKAVRKMPVIVSVRGKGSYYRETRGRIQKEN